MENMVAESLKYMVLGMGIVFVFLYLLVLILQIQAKLVAKFFPERPAKPAPRERTLHEKRKIAAITAAIAHHKYLKGHLQCH